MNIDSILKKLSSAEQDAFAIQSIKDIVLDDFFLFAKHILGYKDLEWDVHGECTKALESDAKKKLIVMPRGSFKCLSVNTLVTLPSGYFKEIKDLKIGDQVLSHRGDGFGPETIINKSKVKIMDGLRITFRSGLKLETSLEHPFLAIHGWIKAKDLTVGKRLAQWAGSPIECGKKQRDGLAWFVGMMTGDGSCLNQAIYIDNPGLIERMRDACEKLGFGFSKRKAKNTWGLLGIANVLKEFDLKKKSVDKRIHPKIFGWSLSDRRAFLGAYLSCDGYSTPDGKVTISTASEGLAWDAHRLFKTIGVFSTIRSHIFNGKTYYAICIVDPISQKNLMKCPHHMKSNPLRVSSQDGFWRSVPKEWRKIAKPFASRSNGVRIDNNYDTSFTKFKRFAEEIGLEWAVIDEIIWDQISKIERIKLDAVDIEVTGESNYVANGMVVHNSSLGSVAYPMWRLEKDPNMTILLDSELYTNSKNLLREIKGHYASSTFQKVFGNRVGPKWDEGEIILSTRTRNRKEASITVGGIETTKVGQHYDAVVGDDYNSANNSDTPEKCQKVIDHFKYNLNILNPGGEYLIIGTRYAELDVIGFLLSNVLEEKFLAEGKLKRGSPQVEDRSEELVGGI